MTFLQSNTKSMIRSLDIGCLTFSVVGPKLLRCNAQARQYLQTSNHKNMEEAINLKALLPASKEGCKGVQSYTLMVKARMFQLMVYPPDRKNHVTVLLIPVDGPPRMLGSRASSEEAEHDMLFRLDETFTIVDVQNQGKAHHLQVPAPYVVGKTLAQLVHPPQLDHYLLVFARAKETNTRQSLFYRTSKRIGFRFLKIVIQWEGVTSSYRVWVDDISTGGLPSTSIGTGFLIMNADSMVEYADAACLDLLGKEKSAVLGSDIRTLFRPLEGGSFFDICYSPRSSLPKLLRFTTFPSPHKGKKNYTIIQVSDITATENLQAKNGFVNLLLQVTYQLLQASSDNLDTVLHEILKQMGTFCAADHLSIYQADTEIGSMSCSHRYNADVQEATIDELKTFRIGDYPNWYEALKLGQEVYIFSIDDLPDSWQAERALLAHYKVSSVLMEPILSDKQLLGFIGLDTRERSLQWTEEMRGFLYLFANILGSFFARMQSEQRLKVALASADDLLAQREKMSRSLQSFYTKINHDTRNSLNAVQASCSLLGQTVLDEQQRRYLATIESNSLFLLHLIRDFLDFSSLTDQPIVLHEQSIPLLDVVRNSVIAIRTLAEEKGLEVDVQWDRSIPSSVISDPVRLCQILINLLHNAVKFTTEGSITVTGKLVDLKPDSVCVQLCVSDTGKGMDEQAVHRFFVPRDAQPIPSFGEGYGLGLGIVKQLSQALKATLEVQSSRGEGTKFALSLDFKLPVGQEPADTHSGPLNVLVAGRPSAAMSELFSLMQADCVCHMHVHTLPVSVPKYMDLVFIDTALLTGSAACKQLAAYAYQPPVFLFSPVFNKEEHESRRCCRAVAGYVLDSSSPVYNRSETVSKLVASKTRSPSIRQQRRLSVLVVDDSVITQELMRHHLQALNVELLTANGGAQALSLLKDCSVDLVLTDMRLPDFDGIALTERIRTFTDVKKRSVPVVLVSAFIDEDMRQRSASVGILECLLKPVEREALEALLETLHR